jgi:hypothetical protein
MKYFKYILISVIISISTITLKASDYSLSVTDRSTEVNLFPNPIVNGDVLTIIAEKNIDRIEVLNILGQPIKNVSYFETVQAKLNIDELKEGIYIIKISFVDKTSSTRRLWVK